MRFAIWALALVCSALPSAVRAEGERISQLLAAGQKPVVTSQVAPNIWVASGNGNAYLVTTPAGAVVIDTGLATQAEETHAALSKAAGAVSVLKLVLTHAHEDHIGGAELWKKAGVELITHRLFPLRQEYYASLADYRDRRAQVLWAGVMPRGQGTRAAPHDLKPDRLVDDVYAFELGATQFEVLAFPGGEGPDAVAVWLPGQRALFAGDALGPAAATFPNLFTLRGENIREPIPMLQALDRAIALGPELLLPGHFEPLRGKGAIADLLGRTARAIRYVNDATLAGMNAGKSVWTLMREIRLPPELGISEQYGRVPWGVRAIYELHTGWFRYESTTELYDRPVQTIYGELAELAGGADAVAERARAHADAKRPLEALHFAEIALAADARHKGALEAQRDALKQLAAEDGGKNFQISGWLRHAIADTETRLAH
jgi:glyoxylase-like metal-dependent hydrolase (beta-lactamase superfamily II)